MESTSTSSSRTSTSMEESKHFLEKGEMGTSDLRVGGRERHGCFRRFAPTAFNLLIFIVTVAVWSHVHVLLGKFDCEPRAEEDHFEPDLLFDTPITFQPHQYYGGPPGNKTDEVWQRLSPPGDGIVELPNEMTYNLPASLPAPNNPTTHKVYGVSMFHQLHCLNFLRFAYYPETVTDMPVEEVAQHRDHCLDYIRQALMCAGDATFEPLTPVGINGMGATHQCRNFERMFSWAYDHRSDKIDGSGYTNGTPEQMTHTPGHRNDFDGVAATNDDGTTPGSSSPLSGHHHHSG